MSADNGIYILKTPSVPLFENNMYSNNTHEYEFRVAYCSAIDNIDYSDLYLPLLFGKSQVFTNKEDALKEAIKLEKEYGWTEYGICSVEKEALFPNMTAEAARIALNPYQGSIPLDVPKNLNLNPSLN